MDSQENKWNTQTSQSSASSFSSPIRPSSLSSRNDMDILEDIHHRQQDRANRMHYPLSSPIRDTHDHSSHRGSHWHHQYGRTAVVNRRNKHDKLREIRERHRQDKLGVNREKLFDRHAYEQYKMDLEREANELANVTDIDELIRHENENESHASADLPKHVYETELDDFLRDQQLELEEMVCNLDISDKQDAA